MLLWIFLILIPYVFCANKECPGGTHSCVDTTTCCELADKSYGCCPLENAVCCDDHIHCCPQNTKCEAGLCIEVSNTNISAKKFLLQDKNIRCSSAFSCPDDSTCCKTQAPGIYACCPLIHAVCCSDGVHCCPKDTVCDMKKQKCVGKNFISEMYDSQKNRISKFGPSKYLLKPINVTSIVCPGGFSQCPDGYTCCKLLDGNWGCCPFDKATCCKDQLHCCPHNMQCDSTSKSCFQGYTSIPSMQKELSRPVNVGIICPDNTTCVDTTTCCAVSEEQYGCCPYQDAVCCEDLTHCCPNDYFCDIVEKRCVPNQKWASSVPKYKKSGLIIHFGN